MNSADDNRVMPGEPKADPPFAVKAAGFFIGFGAFVGIIVGAVIMVRRHIPIDLSGVGLGGALFGVAAGLAGIDFAALLYRNGRARAIAAGVLAWWLAIAAYIGIIDPFAPYIQINDALRIAGWLVFPPLAALGLYGLIALWRRYARRWKP
jgi:hypothetical protein